MGTTLPRGLRNKNPLNIKKSENRWKGKVTPSTDKVFEQFEHPLWGIRAAFIIVRTYLSSKYRCKTVADVISRFAPSSENNTAAYVRAVCQRSGISPTELLHFNDKDQMCRLLYAMAWHENGQEIDMSSFIAAYDLV